MSAAWPMVPLGALLARSDDWTPIVPTSTYREVTVRLWGNGVSLRREALGGEIKADHRLRVRAGQFILSRIDARNGASGLIPRQLDGAVVSSDFPVFDVNAERLLPEFLGWLAKTGAFVDLCRAASEGTTNRVRLKEDRFLRMQIPLPPLAEQRRIVARIDQLAAKIAEARGLRRIADLEAHALFISEYRRTYSPSGAATWPHLAIQAACEQLIDYRGRTPPIAESGIPHITSANIRNGRIDWATSKFVTRDTYATYMTRGIPRQGDVLFTMEAPLGEAAVVPDDRVFSLAQRTLLLRGRANRVTGPYLACTLMSPPVREAIHGQATGTTIRGIASKRLRHIPIPVPSLREQHRIVAYLDDLQAKVDRLKTLQAQTAAELDALLPAILDRAFKGEL